METRGAPVCAQCHARGGGCCRLSSAGADFICGLTQGEIRAMSQASGLPPEDFVVQDQASEEFMSMVDRLHPIFRRIMPEGRRRRLKVLDNGDCCFLTPEGCALPMEARPLYCLIYPFWFTRDRRLMVQVSESCLAQQGARSWVEVLARLGLEEGLLRQWFARLEELAGPEE